METKRFLTGLGLGMAAGGAIGMMLRPKMKVTAGRNMVSRALRSMGDVVDEVADVFGK